MPERLGRATEGSLRAANRRFRDHSAENRARERASKAILRQCAATCSNGLMLERARLYSGGMRRARRRLIRYIADSMLDPCRGSAGEGWLKIARKFNSRSRR